MNRISTAKWEEVKHLQNKCLCYSKEKGLYVSDIISAVKENVLFLPHGYKGFWNQVKTIQEENLKIKLETKFGCGNASFLRATVNFCEKHILDFDISKLYVYHCSITTLDVPIYRWDLLFEKIINAYNATSFENFTTSAIVYIDKLSEILDRNVISVKGHIDNEKETQYKGEYMISLYVGRKIQDLVEGLETAEVSDSTILKCTMNLCRKFIKKLKDMTCDHEMSTESLLPEYLLSVHKFMCANKKGKEYLNIILDKEL